MIALAFLLFLAGPCLGADLVDMVIADPKASTLEQLVVKAGLVDTLKGGTFTILAPTDAAFGRVPSDVLSGLLTDTNALADLLKYHVIPGTVYSKDLRDELQAKTVADKMVRFNIYSHNNVVTANGKVISQPDVKADNGVIHFIDDVIMPPTKTMVQIVAEDPELSTLLSVVSKAGIADEFQVDPLTLFAPTNAAFGKVRSTDLTKLQSDTGRLKETLEYHGVPHTLFAAGLWNNEFEKSTDSHEDRLRVRVSRDGVTVNNGKVVQSDIQATNGVIHKIDHVLIPIRVAFWLRTGVGK